VSQAMQNYKDSLWGRGALAKMFGTTQRDWAYLATDEAREQRRNTSYERWVTRRKHLAADINKS
jgi:hypothetical protein